VMATLTGDDDAQASLNGHAKVWRQG